MFLKTIQAHRQSIALMLTITTRELSAFLKSVYLNILVGNCTSKILDTTTIEDKAKNATVTMKHFEEAVRKVREQKDLKTNEKLVASYYR